MAAYVKICPRCGHRNDELASACERDAEFLGMVPAIPVHEAPPEPALEAPPPAAETPAPEAVAAPEAEAEPLPPHALYLDLEETAQYFAIRDGWVVGQAHPSSTAEVQLSGVEGVNYVHRRHCAFEYRDGRWHVRPLAQPDYTNPTFLNDKRVAPGESATLRNGDRLRLSNVTLRIRIVDL